MSIPECSYRSWLIKQKDPNIEVMLIERKWGQSRNMQVVGDESNLREFFGNTCCFCSVMNTTGDLVPIDERNQNLLSFSCPVDEVKEGRRQCVNDYEAKLDDFVFKDFDVIVEMEDHLLEIGPVEMDLLYKMAGYSDEISGIRVNGKMTFKYSSDFEIVVREASGMVGLMGDGEKVLAFMQKNCSICNANPYPDKTIPDIVLARIEAAEVICCPMVGKKNQKKCC